MASAYINVWKYILKQNYALFRQASYKSIIKILR